MELYVQTPRMKEQFFYEQNLDRRTTKYYYDNNKRIITINLSEGVVSGSMAGEITNKQGITEEQFLLSYDASKFERPSVTVDMLIFTVTEEEKRTTGNCQTKY